jgi:hypothetical protein
MVALVCEETAVVVTVKVAVVAPARTVTLAGTVALVVLDERLMAEPPVGAGAPRVTVPVDGLPPVTVVGETETPVKDDELIVRLAVAVTRPWLADRALAEIVAVVVDETADVVTVKVALVAPEATVTVAGTVALVEFDESWITVPPVGAAALIVTVPVELPPPATVVGERVKAVGTRMFRTALAKPEKIIWPQPVTKSHPVPAFEVLPLGNVPFEPEVMSLNTVELPLNE